jgi:hypothetical protein
VTGFYLFAKRFKNLLKMDLENQFEKEKKKKKNFIFPLPNSPSACWPGQPASPRALFLSPPSFRPERPVRPAALLAEPGRARALPSTSLLARPISAATAAPAPFLAWSC